MDRSLFKGEDDEFGMNDPHLREFQQNVLSSFNLARNTAVIKATPTFLQSVAENRFEYPVILFDFIEIFL